MIFGREPTLWLNVIKATLTLLIVYGVNVNQSQQDAILGIASIVIVFIVGSVVQRQLVTPTAAPRLPDGTSVNGGQSIVEPVI
jgi:phage tail sheath gpL-like